MKHVKVEYIDAGGLQGGEEDVFKAGIGHGEECIVISKKNFKLLTQQNKERLKIREFIYDSKDGDLDFIKFQIAQLDKKKKL